MANNPLDKILGKAKAFAKDALPSNEKSESSIENRNYRGDESGIKTTSDGFYSDPPERPLPRPLPDYDMQPWFVTDEPGQPKYSTKQIMNRIVRTSFGLGGLVFVIGGVVWAMSLAVQIFAE